MRTAKNICGVPMHVIEVVTLSDETNYRLEIDVTLVTTSPRRQTAIMSVLSRAGAAPRVDQDSVVFFD